MHEFNEKSRRPTKGRPPVRYTKEETREQLSFVASLDARYATAKQISELWEANKGSTLTRNRVTWLIKRVRELWAEEDQAARPYWKARQIRSVESDIVAARLKGDWKTVASLQKLLSDLQGTREPIRVEVDVTVTQAIAAVIGTLPMDRLTELLVEQRGIEEDATRYRRMSAGEVVAENEER